MEELAADHAKVVILIKKIIKDNIVIANTCSPRLITLNISKTKNTKLIIPKTILNHVKSE